MLPSLGSTFAHRYVIRHEVGRGSSGVVFAAHDLELSEMIALKVMYPPESTDDLVLEYCRQEVRLARRVTHPNVARVFDMGTYAGSYYLTMELVEGRSLRDHDLAREPLSAGRAVGVALQLCEGLNAAHQQRVVHQDLKPGNILVQSSGRVAITDFGIARMLGHAPGPVRDSMLGTPVYMAPEQVLGRAIGAYTDLYALGIVMYEMLTGRVPFRESTPLATAQARTRQRVPDPRLHARVPDELATIVLECLERDPRARPDCARDVARALSRFTDEQTLVTFEDPTGPRGPSLLDAAMELTEPSERRSEHPCIAILPLRYQGAADDAFVAEALTDELVDLLSMTRGLKVLAASACARFADSRDPQQLREQLGAEWVVDGYVRCARGRLRVNARLIDARSNVQVWNERLDSRLDDVFELQDALAHRIAETLRLQVSHVRGGLDRSGPTAEAMRLYLHARSRCRSFDSGGPGPDGALALLGRCLELAPDLEPAIALEAQVLVDLRWVATNLEPDPGQWSRRCREAVARAVELAPEQPESHLAAARMAAQDGDYRGAIASLRQALSLAPTCAAARGYLGGLLCEAGRWDQCRRHLGLALELEPNELLPRSYLVRGYAMRGEHERAQSVLSGFQPEDPIASLAMLGLRVRMAVWRDDRSELETLMRRLQAHEVSHILHDLLVAMGRTVLGSMDIEELFDSTRANVASNPVPRVQLFVYQIEVETLAYHGLGELALDRLAVATEQGLIDVDWLQWCPVLSSIRTAEGFVDALARVQERASAIWIADPSQR